jgi:outer membrane biosynthesis protein TonB
VPSAAIRFALEAAFLILVAVGAGLAQLDPLVIVALMAVAWVLVALVERASAREAARAIPKDAETPEPDRHVDLVEPVEEEPEPEPTVSERGARAILATGPPPVPEPERVERMPEPEPSPEPRAEPAAQPEPAPEPEPAPQPEPEPELEPEPEPEPEPHFAGPPREWNLWELERLVRDRPADAQQEEQAALVVSLRDFARPDGTLPLEFDQLVRESFGALLSDDGVPSEAAAAP